MPRRSSAQSTRVSRPRSSSRLTRRVVADDERAAARASWLIRMCQPSWRERASSTVNSTTDRSWRRTSSRSRAPSMCPCRAARVRHPEVRTSTAESAIPMHTIITRVCNMPRMQLTSPTSSNCTRGIPAKAERLGSAPASCQRKDSEPMPLGLIALALGGFGIGLTEFVIAGLISTVATDMGVTIPVAGYLISGYALAVVVGALGLTLVLGAWRPKRALLALMVLFIVGNALSAVATGYGMLLAGRVVAALAHGAFFGIGSVLAASLVTPDRRAGAISIMFGGLTLANVLGVPLGTFVGQQWGWRATFALIAVVGVVAAAGIALLVPDTGASDGRPTSLRSELEAFRNRQVWFSLAMTVLVFGGMFGAFMYVEP